MVPLVKPEMVYVGRRGWALAVPAAAAMKPAHVVSTYARNTSLGNAGFTNDTVYTKPPFTRSLRTTVSDVMLPGKDVVKYDAI